MTVNNNAIHHAYIFPHPMEKADHCKFQNNAPAVPENDHHENLSGSCRMQIHMEPSSQRTDAKETSAKHLCAYTPIEASNKDEPALCTKPVQFPASDISFQPLDLPKAQPPPLSHLQCHSKGANRYEMADPLHNTSCQTQACSNANVQLVSPPPLGASAPINTQRTSVILSAAQSQFPERHTPNIEVPVPTPTVNIRDAFVHPLCYSAVASQSKETVTIAYTQLFSSSGPTVAISVITPQRKATLTSNAAAMTTSTAVQTANPTAIADTDKTNYPCQTSSDNRIHRSSDSANQKLDIDQKSSYAEGHPFVGYGMFALHCAGTPANGSAPQTNMSPAAKFNSHENSNEKIKGNAAKFETFHSQHDLGRKISPEISATSWPWLPSFSFPGSTVALVTPLEIGSNSPLQMQNSYMCRLDNLRGFPPGHQAANPTRTDQDKLDFNSYHRPPSHVKKGSSPVPRYRVQTGDRVLFEDSMIPCSQANHTIQSPTTEIKDPLAYLGEAASWILKDKNSSMRNGMPESTVSRSDLQTSPTVQVLSQTLSTAEAILKQAAKESSIDRKLWKDTTKEILDLKKRTCPICNKVYARVTILKNHLRRHTGEKPYQCMDCGRRFSQASTLENHRRIHNGSRPFQCKECLKTFTHQTSLKTHLRIHTGERPYQCEFPSCRRKFADGSTLHKHRRIHNGERPFRCTYCDKSFTQSGNLRRHVTASHSKKTQAKV